MKNPFHHRGKIILGTLGVSLVAGLITGTFRNQSFWRSADQRGDAWMRQGKFDRAAKTYSDPWRIANALYRAGSFKEATHEFARVPGAVGRYNAGNSWLMIGSYEQAIASYNEALKLRPGWKEAEDNKALALARKSLLDASGKDAAQESADAYDPDEIVMDGKKDETQQPVELAKGGPTNDAAARELWLRRIQTTPGEFLKAKFSYQVSSENGNVQK